VAERRASLRALWLAKPLASATFVWAALAAGALGSTYGRWILAGLLACALGDVLLIARGAPRTFRAGMLAFGVGHALFSVAFVSRGLVGTVVLAAGLATALALRRVWRWLAPQLGTADRTALGPYLVVIGGMVSCALGAAAAGVPAFAAAGALLFALSDLAVAKDRFVRPSFVSTLWGLPSYYAAQLLLAASTAA
jgi:uncharacterized membrane protein YhhN